MKTITKLIVSAVLMCAILPASAQKSQVLEIKFQGLDATLYSKSIDEQYLSEIVLYCPSLMNGIKAQKAMQMIVDALDSGAEKANEAMASFERPKDILENIMR